MNSKFAALFFILPALALFAYKFLMPPASTVSPGMNSAAKTTTNSAPIKKNEGGMKKKNEDKIDANARYQKISDDGTDLLYSYAAEAEAEVVDVYQKNDPKIVAEMKNIFDVWDLKPADRSAVADAVSHYRHEVALLWNEYYRSWPVAVGHATNTLGGADQLNQLAKKIDAGKVKLQSSLAPIVGENRAKELNGKIHPTIKRKKEIDD
ncbi:MAG: hypothetical protein NTV80_01210 [Verrucomicrobia bacterium]|nr:hypothetical protein [Verrucomicrobiota bacterium]